MESRLGAWSWRYIHYNRKLFGKGTRDEYRLLHVAAFLRAATPDEGALLELVKTGEFSLKVEVRPDELREVGELLLWSEGPWKVVRLHDRVA